MIGRFAAPDYALAIAGLCGGLVCATLALEYTIPDMAPCPLCLMQRLWFLVAGLIAYAGLAHNPRWGIYPLLVIVAAVTGGGFAIRQLWLQSLPAGQAPACMDLNRMLEFGQFSQALQAMVSGTGDCAAEPPLLGLPIPLWSLAGFAALIAVAALQWRARHAASAPSA